ncbi:MAG TPA: protein translocase subunit SecD [Candidatus Binatia bacterium]|nr:protein translocase subunit SecD [Candidatus Binatia bacterium]
MQPYARWKYVLLLAAALFGVLYSLPNLFGDEPSVQISTRSGDAVPAGFAERVQKALGGAKLAARSSGPEGQQWVVRFGGDDEQLKAADALKRELGNDYVVALNRAARTPAWLTALGAKHMALGLDLRGGVHFLLEVDLADARTRAIGRYLADVPAFLRKEDIRYSARRQEGEAVVLEFGEAERLAAAQKAIGKEYPELALTAPENATPPRLELRLSEKEVQNIVQRAVEQNLTTLRNRVNQLGVAEPLVQRQGLNRIVVQLPGVQDTTHVKELLGSTATLEYRAVDQDADARQAAATGVVPSGDELFYHRGSRQPYLLKRDVIAKGDELVDAQATYDQQSSQPAVSVTLDGGGAKRMLGFTEKNVGKPMAVLYRENEIVTNYDAQGQPVRERRQIEEIISVATIRGVFGKRFQTTGLEQKEAHDLALLLRAGALAAPIAIVEERTVGASLGEDNIRQGFEAAALGLALVAGFMIFYYRVFGLFAVGALLMNLLIVVAVLSLVGATLTMPGIAGIVLHMGIAVDANVLIYERIREELRAGNSPHAAIQAGYDRAFLTIADANVTVLIGTVVLFALGAGAVKGFAITLAIGIISSQFTAIVGSRAMAQLVFARRKMKDVPVW